MRSLMTKHFVQRIWERYGLCFEESDAAKLVRKILTGCAKFCWCDLESCERYLVDYRGRVFDVIYDAARDCLITAYPSPVAYSKLPIRSLLASKHADSLETNG